MKNINTVEFANKLNTLTSRHYFDAADLVKEGLTPLHDMVSDVRKFYFEYGFEAHARALVRLNDKWSLSIVTNAHATDDVEEGAAQLEIAVVKNNRALTVDERFINLRYNDFLATFRVVKRRDPRVSTLLYYLKKQEELAFHDDNTAAQHAKAFVEYVITHNA